MRRFLVVFCAVLLLIQPAYALTSTPEPTATPEPTSTPEPTATPSQQIEAMLEGISVEAYYDGTWNALQSHMAYAEVNGVLADGALMFSSIFEYVQNNEEIPTVQWSEDFDIRITKPTLWTHFFHSFEIYRMTEEGLQKDQNSILQPKWRELDEGLYLMSIPHWLDDGENYYNGVYFLWLEVQPLA